MEKKYASTVKEQNKKLETQDHKLENQDKRLEKQDTKISNLTKENQKNRNKIDSLKKDKISASSITRFLKWLVVGIIVSVVIVISVDYFTNAVHTEKAIYGCIAGCCAIFAPWFNRIKKLA